MLRPSFEKRRVSDFSMQCSVNPLAFGARFERRSSRCNRPHSASLVIALGALALAACSTSPAHEAPPIFGTAPLHPPPKPGDSISHTQMCECKVCDPVSCCEGPDDDAPATSCGDSYDFSASPSCGGLSVKSCTSRCTREIWRVHVGQDCADKRPDTCCTAG